MALIWNFSKFLFLANVQQIFLKLIESLYLQTQIENCLKRKWQKSKQNKRTLYKNCH